MQYAPYILTLNAPTMLNALRRLKTLPMLQVLFPIRYFHLVINVEDKKRQIIAAFHCARTTFHDMTSVMTLDESVKMS